MALLKQCFCYSLRQGSFIIGSYSLVVYCVAFAVELWWIVESLLILPAPAYTLCALYFFDFIMAAILLFGLLVRQRKYLMSWTLMTVLSFFPEAGMVLFMSLYYWPAHKFEYGVIELVYWSLRAIFNIFGAVCVCSLYLTWRDEELILGRLHDLTLANVETGSTGVGVLRNGNFTGTLKGNSNLAYQNYAYVDSSPGLPDNLSYKNNNAFHSRCKSPKIITTAAPNSRHSFFFHRYQCEQHRKQTNAKKSYHCHSNRHLPYRYCAQCQLLSSSSNTFLKTKEKTVSSLPILWKENTYACSKGVACCISPCHKTEEQQLPPSLVTCCRCYCRVNSSCKLIGEGNGGGGDSEALLKTASSRRISCLKTLSGSTPQVAIKAQLKKSILVSCYPSSSSTLSPLKGPSTDIASTESATVLSLASNQSKNHHHQPNLQLRRQSEPRLLRSDRNGVLWKQNNIQLKTFSSANTNLVESYEPDNNTRQFSSYTSSSFRERNTDSSRIVPKIEIVICTELQGSIETKVIRPPKNNFNNFTSAKKKTNRKLYHLHHCHHHNRHCLPLSHFRRAMSEYPGVGIVESGEVSVEDLASSYNSMPPEGSVDSTTSIIVAQNKYLQNKKQSKSKRRSNLNDSAQEGEGGRVSGGGNAAFKFFAYLANITRCCPSKSATSLLTDSGEDGGLDFDSSGGGATSLERNNGISRGLFNTRSFTMNSDVQATLGNRASLAMKSEFNPAMLFDPAYRKSRISELGIAGIGLEPPGQIPIGTFNRMNRSRSLWNVSNEDYWNRPPPSRPVSMGYVNHIHQLDQLAAHKDCCLSSATNNSNATSMNLNKQMIMKGFGDCGQGYRNPIHGSTTSIATSTHQHHHPSATVLTQGVSANGHHHHDPTCGAILHDPNHRRNWLATGRRAQSVDGLNHFYHRYYGRNIAAHHNLHPGGLLSGDHHSQDWSKSSICPDDPSEDLRNYQDIAL